MERQFPKNVRQIGNVCDEPKIYVEDYVDTYLNQLKGKAGSRPVGAALVGEILLQDGQPVVYVSGAVQMKEIEEEGKEILMGDDVAGQLEEDRKHYFPSSEIVGWCLIEAGKPMGRNREVSRLHSKYFSKDQSIFVWKDSEDGEETFYAYKFGELMQMGGHYIYYEKNPAMQNYMISTRKKIGVTPSEVVEDRAAKDFRSTVRERMDEKAGRQNSRLVYLTSVLLVVVVLAIGISTMNNYDKMEAVQNSLESLSYSMGQAEDPAETDEQTDAEEQTETSKDEEKEAGDAAEVNAEAEAVTEDQQEEGTVPDKSTIQEQLNLTEEDYYTVQKGDTLDTISIKIYGDSSHVDAICRMNGLSDGNLIFIGQKLLLP